MTDKQALDDFEASLEQSYASIDLNDFDAPMPKVRLTVVDDSEPFKATAASHSQDKKPSLWFSEDEVAARFTSSLDGEWCGVSQWNGWASFDAATGVWRGHTDDSGISLRFKKWIRDEYALLEEHGHSEDRRRLEQFFNVAPRRRVVSSAFEEVAIDSSKFDASRDEMLVGNGVVNLRTGELREQSSEDFFTKRSAVSFDASAQSDVWNSILEAFPEDCHEYLQVMIGQSLTGYQPSSSCVLFYHGGGENGKSTFLDVFRAIAGDYCASPSAAVLTMDRTNGVEFYVYKGLRAAIFEELANNRFLNAQSVKRLTGTEIMRSRQLYQREEEFAVMATNHVATNYLPMVSEIDEGTWRRLRVIPAPYRFVDAGRELRDGEKHRIENLSELKRSDDVLQAALAWAVEGARKWFENNRVEPSLPPSVVGAVADWRGDSDKVGSWIHDALEVDETSMILTQDAYDCYCQMMREQGRACESMVNFVNLLKDHPVLRSWSGEYVKRGRHGKLSQSLFSDDEKASRSSSGPFAYMPRIAGESASFIKGVAFVGSGVDDVDIDDDSSIGSGDGDW